MANRFYTMDLARGGDTADVYIFGIITCDPWTDTDVDAHTFVGDLASLGDVHEIRCHIQSYGGEVGDGLAIYNALLSNPASVTTICEGEACSIASVIFMAGDRRVMREASSLYVHDCWSSVTGDADDLRRAADDLDKEMEACRAAYRRGGISDDDLTTLLKGDTWLTPDEAIGYGLATEIDRSEDKVEKAAASARRAAFDRLTRRDVEASLETIDGPRVLTLDDIDPIAQAVAAAILSGMDVVTDVKVEPAELDLEPDQDPQAEPTPMAEERTSTSPMARIAAAMARK